MVNKKLLNEHLNKLNKSRILENKAFGKIVQNTTKIRFRERKTDIKVTKLSPIKNEWYPLIFFLMHNIPYAKLFYKIITLHQWTSISVQKTSSLKNYSALTAKLYLSLSSVRVVSFKRSKQSPVSLHRSYRGCMIVTNSSKNKAQQKEGI